MRVQPDGQEAAGDQAAVVRLLCTVLRNAASRCSGGTEESVTRLLTDRASSPVPLNPDVPELDMLLCYPGFVATAYEAQQVRRAATVGSDERRRLTTRLEAVLQQARSSARRAQDGPCPGWRVDLAPSEPYLRESLARAIVQAPKTSERADELLGMTVAGWRDEERATFCASGCLLASLWPEMLAEMAAVVRQVALLQGYGIDGFTDFTAHGVVFVNNRRLTPADDGLPAEVRFAEALVHEATHNRCNAAGLSHPFLADDDQGSQPLVMTPLRSDPRPLMGLFQQLVVLVRCVVLYDRLREGAPTDGQALRARRERLFRQACQALKTTQRHSDKLTGHGRDVVAEAEDLLKPV
ncbi:MAG: aKG-HExxH-type peptide beta-hydroxylase [Egibacteraceae bacterium]